MTDFLLFSFHVLFYSVLFLQVSRSCVWSHAGSLLDALGCTAASSALWDLEGVSQDMFSTAGSSLSHNSATRSAPLANPVGRQEKQKKKEGQTASTKDGLAIVGPKL